MQAGHGASSQPYGPPTRRRLGWPVAHRADHTDSSAENRGFPMPDGDHGPRLLVGETLQPVDMVRAQLRSIEDGEYGQAYGYLSARAKEQVSYDEFVALIQGNTVVMEPRDSTFQSRHVNGSTATIRGVLEGYGGYVSDVGYVLVKDVDQWRIASFEWSAPRSLKEDTSHPE